MALKAGFSGKLYDGELTRARGSDRPFVHGVSAIPCVQARTDAQRNRVWRPQGLPEKGRKNKKLPQNAARKSLGEAQEKLEESFGKA